MTFDETRVVVRYDRDAACFEIGPPEPPGPAGVVAVRTPDGLDLEFDPTDAAAAPRVVVDAVDPDDFDPRDALRHWFGDAVTELVNDPFPSTTSQTFALDPAHRERLATLRTVALLEAGAEFERIAHAGASPVWAIEATVTMADVDRAVGRRLAAACARDLGARPVVAPERVLDDTELALRRRELFERFRSLVTDRPVPPVDELLARSSAPATARRSDNEVFALWERAPQLHQWGDGTWRAVVDPVTAPEGLAAGGPLLVATAHDDHVQVHLPTPRTHRSAWVRLYEPATRTLVAIAPLQPVGGGLDARLAVRGVVLRGELALDVTDEPDSRPPSATARGIWFARTIAARAATADRTGDAKTAATLWERAGDRWGALGDRDRMIIAHNAASEALQRAGDHERATALRAATRDEYLGWAWRRLSKPRLIGPATVAEQLAARGN